MKENYQLMLDDIITENEKSGRRPRVLLHACCAPCTSSVLEYLAKHFAVTLFFYNPNIYPHEEYLKRLGEMKKLLSLAPFASGVGLIEGCYDYRDWQSFISGTEKEREGGARCSLCFEKRLAETARLASEMKFDYFCTTLTVSPHKNAELINAIGRAEGEKRSVTFLPSDFKKRDGYKRSVELCAEYDIYRQNYCGCEYSIWF